MASMIQSHTKATAAITATSGSTATPPNLYQRSTPCTFPKHGKQQACSMALTASHKRRLAEPPDGHNGLFMIVATEVQLLLADWTSGTPAGSTDANLERWTPGMLDRLWFQWYLVAFTPTKATKVGFGYGKTLSCSRRRTGSQRTPSC